MESLSGYSEKLGGLTLGDTAHFLPSLRQWVVTVVCGRRERDWVAAPLPSHRASYLDDRAGWSVGKGISSWGWVRSGARQAASHSLPLHLKRLPHGCCVRSESGKAGVWKQVQVNEHGGGCVSAEVSGQWAGCGGSQVLLSHFSVSCRSTYAEFHSFS